MDTAFVIPLVVIVLVTTVIIPVIVYVSADRPRRKQRDAARLRAEALAAAGRKCAGCGGLMTGGHVTTEPPGGRFLAFRSNTGETLKLAALRCVNCGRTELYS